MKKALFQCALVALAATLAACGSQLVEFPIDDGTGGASSQSSSTSVGGYNAGAGPQSSSHSSTSSTGAGAGGSGGSETSAAGGSGTGGSGGQGAGGEGGTGGAGGDDHCQVEHDCCIAACEQNECNHCPWGSYSCQDSCTTCKQQCDCQLDQCEHGND